MSSVLRLTTILLSLVPLLISTSYSQTITGGNKADSLQITIDTLLHSDSTAMMLDYFKPIESKTKFILRAKTVFKTKDFKEHCFIGDVNPSGSAAAIVLVDRESQRVIWNGKKSKAYDALAEVCVSPDGSRLGYFFYDYEKGEYYAVVDGEKFGGYLDVNNTIYFSDDGQQYLLSAQKKGVFGSGKAVMVLNGKERKYTNTLATLPNYFSPDGKRCLYFVRDGKECVPVLDGEKLTKYDMTGMGPFWSSDSRWYAHSAMRNDTTYMVINGKEIGGYTQINEIEFSPDASEYSYIASINYDTYVYRGKQKFGPYKDAWHLTYSENGDHFAFVAHRDDSIFVVKDSVEQSKQIDMGWPVLSPDGSHMAYMVQLKIDTLEPEQAVIVDGQLGPVYSYVYPNTVNYSPDGEHYAYLGEIDTLRIVAVIDGIQGKEYQWISEIKFDPTSSQYAYRANIDDSTMCIVRNGVESQYFNSIGFLYFSPDGSHLACVVSKGDSRKIWIDGQVFGGYRVISPHRPHFRDDNSLQFFAEKNRSEVFKVQISPAVK